MGTGLLYSPAESAQLLPLVSKIHAAGLQIVGACLFLLHSHTESAQLLPLESESCRQPCTAALILEDHLPLGGSCKAVATLEPNYRDFGRHSYMHRCIVCSCTVERDTRKTNMLCCTSQGGCPPFPWTRASSASPKISERAENTLEMPRRRAEGAAELQS